MRDSTVFLIVSTAFLNLIFTGCSRPAQPADQRHSIAAAPAVKAAIETDCVVRYYKSNASAYLTRQQHRYNPRTGYFEATAKEPTGIVRCSLERGVFTSSEQKKELLSDLPGSFFNKDLALILFYGFCAGGDLLDTASMTAAGNVRIEGRWYDSFRPAWPTDCDVTVLRSIDSRRVELVKLADVKNDLNWLVRCYNYRYSRELEKRIPRTIDLYNIADGVASKALMIRFDYKEIRTLTPVQEPN